MNQDPICVELALGSAQPVYPNVSGAESSAERSKIDCSADRSTRPTRGRGISLGEQVAIWLLSDIHTERLEASATPHVGAALRERPISSHVD